MKSISLMQLIASEVISTSAKEFNKIKRKRKVYKNRPVTKRVKKLSQKRTILGVMKLSIKNMKLVNKTLRSWRE